jgi:hypothetical protein
MLILGGNARSLLRNGGIWMVRKRCCLCERWKVALFYGYGAARAAGLGSTPPGAGQSCDTALASVQGTGTRGDLFLLPFNRRECPNLINVTTAICANRTDICRSERTDNSSRYYPFPFPVNGSWVSSSRGHDREWRREYGGGRGCY